MQTLRAKQKEGKKMPVAQKHFSEFVTGHRLPNPRTSQIKNASVYAYVRARGSVAMAPLAAFRASRGRIVFSFTFLWLPFFLCIFCVCPSHHRLASEIWVGPGGGIAGSRAIAATHRGHSPIRSNERAGRVICRRACVIGARAGGNVLFFYTIEFISCFTHQ